MMSSSIEDLQKNVTSARKKLAEQSPQPMKFIFNEGMRQINKIDTPNFLHKAADFAYSVGSIASNGSQLISKPWIARLAAGSNALGHALTVTGYLYNHFGRGDWSLNGAFEQGKVPDDRKLHYQPFENPLAARRALEQGGTFYDAYLRMKSSIGYPSAYNYSDFARVLSSTGLVDTYKASHPHSRIEESLRSHSDIGGIASDVGIIEGLKDSIDDVLSDEAIFCINTPDGRMPCSDLELRELIRTIANGVFLHDTVPFFSLHFNKDGILYPVIHPAYQNTIVGRVVSLLDYYMKCYLNGGFYSEDFLQTWHESQNTDKDYLKSHLKEFKDYCSEQKLPRYISLRQAISYEDLQDELDEKSDIASSKMKFQLSFRIISQQKTLQKHDNIFIINPDFRVEYTIKPSAEYQESLNQYIKIHGHYPKEYQKLQILYQKMANTIKSRMPTLPFLRNYFQMLGIMGFFSYYFTTLKEMGKSPLLPQSSVAKQFIVPKAFPPIPVRHYQHQTVNISIKQIFNKLNEKNPLALPEWMRVTLENSSQVFPEKLEKDLKYIIHEHIMSQLPTGALVDDLDALNELESTLYDTLLNQGIRSTLVRIHESAQKEINDIIHQLKSIQGSYTPEYKNIEGTSLLNQIQQLREYINNPYVQIDIRYSYNFSVEELREIDKQRKLVHDKIDSAEEKNIRELENYIAGQIPAGQEHLYQINGLTIAAFKQTKIQEIRDEFSKKRKEVHYQVNEFIANAKLKYQLDEIEKIILNPKKNFSFDEHKPIQARVLYSMLHFSQEDKADYNMKIVGGCGVHLPKIISKTIPAHETVIPAVTSAAEASIAEQFRSVTLNDKNYAIFKLPILDKPVYSQIDQVELSDTLIRPKSLPKMADKEIKAMTHFMTGLFRDKKEGKEEKVPEFNPLARDTAGQTLTHYAASYSNKEVGNGWLLSKTSQQKQEALIAKDEHGNQPIHIAAQSGNLEAIGYITSAVPASIEAKNNNALTPLMIAAESGQASAVKKLLSLGANPNHRLPNGLFALYMAIQSYSEETVDEILKSNKESLNYVIDSGTSPLHLAIETKQVALALKLIREGANLLLPLRADGYIPLHLAAEMGLGEVCKEILSRTLSPNIALPNGKTALHIAAEKGHIKTLQTLLSSKSILVNIQDADGETPIMLALKAGQTDAALILAKQSIANLTNKKKETVSLIAAKYGQFCVADILIERGESPLIQDEFGDHYAYWLLRTGNQLRYQNIATKHHLSSMGKFHNKSALKIAVDYGHPLLVADLYVESKTPLSVKAWEKLLVFALKNDDLALLKKLSKHPSWDPHYLFHDGNVEPFTKALADIAAESGSEKCLKWLHAIYKKIPPKAWCKNIYGEGLASGKTSIAEMLLAECDHVDIRESERNKGIAAKSAVQFGHLDLIEFLHRRGTDFSKIVTNPQDHYFGCYIFETAIESDDAEMLRKLFSLTPKEKWPDYLYADALKENSDKCLEVLYEYQLKGEEKTTAAETNALQAACTYNNMMELKKLLTLGIKPQPTEKKEDHPLYIVCKNNNVEAARLLMDLCDRNTKKNALKAAINNHCIDTIIIFWQSGFISQLNKRELRNCLRLAENNKYCLAALKGDQREYEADKLQLINALKESDHITFKKLISEGLPVNYNQYNYNDESLPLIHCVIARKAEWAIPILKDHRVDFYVENARGYDPIEQMMISCGEDAEQTVMTSPFQFIKKHLGLYEYELVVNHHKMNRTIIPDLAVIKKHPEALNYYASFAKKEILFSSVKLNEYDWVKKLLIYDDRTRPENMPSHDGRLINQLNRKRQSSLMIASAEGHMNIVRLLITKDANPDLIDIQQNTALHHAILNNHTEIALQLAAITKNIEQQNRQGLTPFLSAVMKGNLALVKVLHNMGCDIHVVNKQGFNAMHLAALSGNAEIINYLADELNVNSVQKPIAKFDAIDATLNTPLHLAAIVGREENFMALATHGADLFAENSMKKTPLDYAVINKNPKFWDLISRLPLIEKVDYKQRLFLAAAAGDNVQALMDLIAMGCDIDTVNKNGNNALHIACINGNIKATCLLIDNKIDIHMSDAEGNICLHYAAQTGFISGLKQLHVSGTNMNAKNKMGQTALHMACEYKQFPAVVQLLKAGVVINMMNNNGLSPIHLALKNEDWQTVHLLHLCDRNSLKVIPLSVDREYRKYLELVPTLNFPMEDRREMIHIISRYQSMQSGSSMHSMFKGVSLTPDDQSRVTDKAEYKKSVQL